MSRLLVRTEAELHTKFFRKGIPRIDKITAMNGIPDAVFPSEHDGNPRFVEYKVIAGQPKSETPITYKYLGLRPQQVRFLSKYAPASYLAVLVKSHRRVSVFAAEVVDDLGPDARWDALFAHHGVLNVSIDAPQLLESLS